MSTSDAIEALAAASKGLLYQSESDEPFETFTWGKANGELTGPQVLKCVKKAAKTSVKEIAVADFFKDLTAAEDWHGDEEKAVVQQYKKLLEVIRKNLPDAKVFKVGKTKVDVYVAGKTDEGDWAGVKTAAVET